jgi:hypothetical protein
VRYQASVPNSRGRHPGIFALCNGLARSGALNEQDRAWWRASNDALQVAYVDPATVDPTIFDRSIHPVVTCWFKETAIHLLEYVPGYLAMLDRHLVSWEKLGNERPGTILYEDDDQVVVEPRFHPGACDTAGAGQ